jgi:diguanylate cyclase
MNNTAYIAIMSAIASILLVFFVFLMRKKSTLLRVLKMMIGFAFLILATYIPALFCPEHTTSTIFYSLYFISNTWLCLSIYLFGHVYIKKKPNPRWMKIAFTLFIIADNLSLLCNTFANHEVYYEFQTISSISCWKFKGTWWFQIHLALCYIFLGVFFIEIIQKLIKVPRLYKEQYGVILAILLVCIIGNGIFLIQSDTIDLSVILYGFAGIAFYYFSIDFLPHKLRRDMGQLILNKMNSSLAFFDLEGRCVFANDSAQSLFKMIPNQSTLKKFVASIGLKEESLSEKQVSSLADEKGTRTYLVNYQGFTDSHKRYLGCFFRLDDITAEQEEQQRKLYLATHDRLTGVYNQDTFFREARKAIDANPSVPYCIITTNVSQFKLLNDFFGQEVGDRLLIDIAMIIDSFNGPGIMYGRLESDKFGLCVPCSTNLEEKIEEKIEAHIAEIRKQSNLTLMVFNQCGVYRITDPSLSIQMMCDRANMALNSFKGDVQHKISYYDTNMLNEMLLENELISELPEALEKEEFVVYFQPQIDSSTNKIVGAEALVRWNHPTKGLIPPGKFIPLFERTGHIYELDRYIWAHTCQKQKYLRSAGYLVPLSVNISPRDVYSADVCQVISGLIDEYGIPPESLNLEITESAVILDMDKMNDIIKRLKEKGFRIEMDDFGSGYSSLNTLKDIHVDVLKLDMLFLKSIKGSERGAKILSAIIALARSIETPIIAEGAEDHEQVDFLLNLGCHNIQGYYYSKPIPFDSLLEFFKARQTGPLS